MTKLYYCWFGSALPEYVQRNVEQYKVFFDADIILINEDNFDISQYSYAKQAYDQGYYAFVSDVARLHFLYETGGIYLDATVTIKQNFEHLLKQHMNVFGIEYYQYEICGVLGAVLMAQPKSVIFKEVLSYYKHNDFSPDKTINQLLSEQLESIGFKYKNQEQILTIDNNTVYIAPTSYFSKGSKSIYGYPNSQGSWTVELSRARKVRRFIGKMIKRVIGRTRYNKYFTK